LNNPDSNPSFKYFVKIQLLITFIWLQFRYEKIHFRRSLKKDLNLICVPHILRAMACAVKNKNHNTQTSVLMG